jgi:adenylylsulfate kinase-like enzyme
VDKLSDLLLIESKIVTNLQKDVKLIKVYDHEPSKMPQLPAATIFFDGFSQDDNSSRNKRSNWRWTIRIYVSLRDAETAQRDIKSLLLEARKNLANDPILGGTCLYQQVTNGEIYVFMDQQNPHLMAELTLVATTNEPY